MDQSVRLWRQRESFSHCWCYRTIDDNFYTTRSSRASAEKKIWRDCEKLFSTAVFEGRLKTDKLGYHKHSKLSKSRHQFKRLSNSIYTGIFLKNISTCKKCVCAGHQQTCSCYLKDKVHYNCRGYTSVCFTTQNVTCIYLEMPSNSIYRIL